MPLNARAIYPSPDPHYVHHASRRSVVHSTHGMVACSQPLAAEAGQRILKMGGNAADAAVAVAAALNVTEPSSTGIGGDMFCLYFDAQTRQVRALNGSGRTAKNSSLERVRKDLDMRASDNGKIPTQSALGVTVPGAAAGWVDTVEKFGSGKVTMEQILTPAIELAENGFPVSEISAWMWRGCEQRLKDASPNFREVLQRDSRADQFARAPQAGEIFRWPTLAKTFRALAAEGKKGFYTGKVANAIIEVLGMLDSHMTLEDLEEHMKIGTEETQPISLKFTGQRVGRGRASRNDGASDGHAVELWEHPPNGQGIVALITLGLLQELEKEKKILTFSQEDHNTADYLHAVIECLRIAFADAAWWVTDPNHSSVTAAQMLSPSYLSERAKLFDAEKANQPSYGQPGGTSPSPAHNHCDTVYLCVTDKDQNGISFINSTYHGFGSCIVAPDTGVVLQNRGCNFELGPSDHPNIYAPSKRPYHTIIPGLVTHGANTETSPRELHSVYGVMGGFMQPQGHVQVLLNMEVFGLNPQQALDAPRICIGGGMPDTTSSTGGATDHHMTVYVEEGIPEETVAQLRRLGHKCEVVSGFARTMFGRGQVIRRHVDERYGVPVYSGGSDLRGDGCVLPA